MERISEWRRKYKTLAAYYRANYPPEYYTLTPEELQIDPDELPVEVEKYNRAKQESEFIKCAESFPVFLP